MAVTNKLTAFAVDRYKPTDKVQKFSDGGGMYLQVNPNGSKWWRLAYRLNGKQQLKSLGVYPKVSLADARKNRDAFDPTPPVVGKTLNEVFDEFVKIRKSNTTVKYQSLTLSRCAPVLVVLGSQPIKSIRAAALLEQLRVIEKRTKSVARKVRSDFSQCYDYAYSINEVEINVARGLIGALVPVKGGHRPAVIEPVNVGKLLDFIRVHPTVGIITRFYHEILPYVFVRPGELRNAKWADFDFDAAEWKYNMGPIAKRVCTDHIVPLSRQVLKFLHELHKFTGHTPYLFTHIPGRNVISDMTANQTLNRSEWKGLHCPHGWRATARTMLEERLYFSTTWAELQLGHLVRDPLGGAYGRAAFLIDRKDMMQKYADYLDSLRKV